MGCGNFDPFRVAKHGFNFQFFSKIIYFYCFLLVIFVIKNWESLLFVRLGSMGFDWDLCWISWFLFYSYFYHFE